MSGICGWIQLNGKTEFAAATSLFEPMTSALTHRGPDDHGAVVFDNAVLLQRTSRPPPCAGAA